MKGVYPIVIKRTDNGYYVEIPDFEIATQGNSVADSMEMARDAIGLMGIDMEDDKKELPKPYSHEFSTEKEDIVNKNLNCILCKDKISETKINLSNPTFGVNFEKCNEIVIDKINEMEAMKDMLSKYEDFVKYLQNENGDEELEIAMKCKEELTSYNSLLKDNNIKLKEIIMELMRNTENSINENLMLRINKVINETSYQGEVYDDLVAMMKVQAMLIEYDIGKGIYN